MALVTLYFGHAHGMWRHDGCWAHSHTLGAFFTRDVMQTKYQTYHDIIMSNPSDPGYDHSEWYMDLDVTEMLALKMRHPSKDEDVYLAIGDSVVHPQ